MRVDGVGPTPASLMIVGEAPGAEEELRGQPFVGASGAFLDSCLQQAGLDRRDIFLTNVARTRPPENKIEHFFVNPRKMIPGAEIVSGIEKLKEEVSRVNPSLIIAMGNTALWALSSNSATGILNWRGSHLECKPEFGGRKLIPTVHPAYILRQYADRPFLLADLNRARLNSTDAPFMLPNWRFQITPTLPEALRWIDRAIEQGLYASDIETLGGSITCIGIGLSATEVMCIPFIDPRKPNAAYWEEDEERMIWRALRRLASSRAQLIGQNYAYDAFYKVMRVGIYFKPRWDIMIMHHMLFSGMEKSLALMASLYCKYFKFWKDDGKLWNPKKVPPEQLWTYNCTDLAYTWEVYETLRPRLEEAGLMEQYNFQIGDVWELARDMEFRGVRINKERKERFKVELLEFQMNIMKEIEYVLAHPLNPNSSPQMQALFYGDFGERPIYNRATSRLTLDDGALEQIARRSPHLRRLVQRITDYRSATRLNKNYACMPLDHDGRARTTFNTAGANTYRWASSKSPFGSGGNLQTISKGDEEEEHEPGQLVVPNLRLMFEPDPGYTWLDIDLEKADLVTVACEAEDEELLQMLEAGYNPYKEAAAEFLRKRVDEVPHTVYTKFKSCIHAFDYVGRPPTVSKNVSIPLSEAERIFHWWFNKHPGIPRWHRRLDAELRARRTVKNCFGYRRVYFDRIEGLLPEAAAWIGQSTTAIAINKALTRIFRELPEVQMLLQVHDSGDMQVRTDRLADLLPEIARRFRVPLSYKRVACIGFELNLSNVSWGAVKKPKPGSSFEEAWKKGVQMARGTLPAITEAAE